MKETLELEFKSRHCSEIERRECIQAKKESYEVKEDGWQSYIATFVPETDIGRLLFWSALIVVLLCQTWDDCVKLQMMFMKSYLRKNPDLLSNMGLELKFPSINVKILSGYWL